MNENSVVAAGLRNPRCLAVLEAMQVDPHVGTRYAGDTQITQFLQEFGNVMSAHFTDLHHKEQQKQQEKNQMIQTQASLTSFELGPLHTEILMMQKERAVLHNNEMRITKQEKNLEEEKETEERRACEVLLRNPVIRELLMDTETQKLLLDCSHLDKLRIRLRNPDTASKIKQLVQLGLLRAAS